MSSNKALEVSSRVTVLVGYVLEARGVACFDFGFAHDDDQLIEFVHEVKENDMLDGTTSTINFKWVTLPERIAAGDSWDSEEALNALLILLEAA